VIACIVAYEFHKLTGQISYALDFGSIIDAIALLLVGAFIEYLHLEKCSGERADTDLLLGIVGEAKSAFTKLSEEAQCCETGKALTVGQRLSLMSAERELSNSVHSVEEGLGHCRITPEARLKTLSSPAQLPLFTKINLTMIVRRSRSLNRAVSRRYSS
jgi:hypothetical protein